MLLDYAMATALGCAGMAGLFHLAGEVLTLQNQVFQYGAAEMVLREVKTLAHLSHGAQNFSDICSETGLKDLTSHCEVLDGWLMHLPNQREEPKMVICRHPLTLLPQRPDNPRCHASGNGYR